VLNTSGANQTYLSFMTRWMSVIPLPLDTSNVVVVGGSISLAPSSNTIGNVTVNSLITETLATRRVDFLVVGTFYRVASVGITTGAEWNTIGAIVNGESEPVIGRLFKCLAIGPAVAGGGECYDVEYTDSVSATVSNLITETLATRRVDFLVVGTFYRVASVGITTGAEWNAIGAIVGGESEPVIGRLFKCLAIGPAVAGGGECYDVEYTTTLSLTDPSTVRIRDTYGDPIVTTAGNLMVGISNIYTANPLHVIVDSVTLPTTSVTNALAVSTTGITIKATTGKLLNLFMNSDGALGTNYVKIYNVAVPTSADTPIFTTAINFGASQNIDCASLNFATAIGVRCTNASPSGDNTPPTNTVNITAFFV
jgi:hypothetical protein